MIPVKVNHNYFTLYEVSRLKLLKKKLIKKSLAFFFLLRCGTFIQGNHRSRSSTIVRSDSICFYFIHTHGKGSGKIWDIRLHSHHWAFLVLGYPYVLRITACKPLSWKLSVMLGPVQTSNFKNYNPRHISWDSCDVFCPPNVGFCELASQKQKIPHWEGKTKTFSRNMVSAPGVAT